MPLTFKDAFGFHTYDQWMDKKYSTEKNNVPDLDKVTFGKKSGGGYANFRTYQIVYNGIGYLPMIGTIAGLVKIILLITMVPENYPLKNAFIFRAFIETTSLGIFLLIPDLIMTYERNVLEAKVPG